MFILYYILCAMVGIAFGIIINKNQKPKCNHTWELIKNYNINNRNRYGEKIPVGFLKVYECTHCKKMRKEEIELD